MKKVLRSMQALRKNDDGASAVEYGLLVALVAVVIAVGVATLGTSLNSRFGNANNCIDNVATTTCP